MDFIFFNVLTPGELAEENHFKLGKTTKKAKRGCEKKDCWSGDENISNKVSKKHCYKIGEKIFLQMIDGVIGPDI